jgi:YwiC-like protein
MIISEDTIPPDQLTRPRHGVRIKTIALPAEHGGWGLLFEPIALGLLLAPSVAGLYLAFSAVALFLARHPLTLVVMNRRRPSPRSDLAKRFAAMYVVAGIASLVAAIAFTQHPFFMPLLIALPLAGVQLAHDWTGRRRVLLPEIAAAIAVSSLAPAIALAGGQPSGESFALWVVMVARAVPSILYVRACLARLHRRPASISPILISHVLAVLVVSVLAGAKLIPLVGVAVMILLLVRAAIGFTRFENVTPKQLGFSEIFFGAVTVLALVLGTIFEL